MRNEYLSGKLTYTVAAFCDAVGIGATKFYELVKAGEIKTVKCGKRTLVTADEAERFVASLSEAA